MNLLLKCRVLGRLERGLLLYRELVRDLFCKPIITLLGFSSRSLIIQLSDVMYSERNIA
jgi:hypothetical protein